MQPVAAPAVHADRPPRPASPQSGLLRAKYEQHPDLAAIVLAMDDATLLYDDADSGFRGENGGRGRNWTGRLLELVRSELLARQTLAD
ncbi:hypothetical protein ABZ924_21810 [Streptomyces sp. NPDC046876]|uniref:hypothetical protein n=1 Tax=Streptomyces sp. NPDC046876 TaxID=3155616 RepID=UPI0033E58FAF